MGHQARAAPLVMLRPRDARLPGDAGTRSLTDPAAHSPRRC